MNTFCCLPLWVYSRFFNVVAVGGGGGGEGHGGEVHWSRLVCCLLTRILNTERNLLGTVFILTSYSFHCAWQNLSKKKCHSVLRILKQVKTDIIVTGGFPCYFCQHGIILKMTKFSTVGWRTAGHLACRPFSCSPFRTVLELILSPGMVPAVIVAGCNLFKWGTVM